MFVAGDDPLVVWQLSTSQSARAGFCLRLCRRYDGGVSSTVRREDACLRSTRFIFHQPQRWLPLFHCFIQLSNLCDLLYLALSNRTVPFLNQPPVLTSYYVYAAFWLYPFVQHFMASYFRTDFALLRDMLHDCRAWCPLGRRPDAVHLCRT